MGKKEGYKGEEKGKKGISEKAKERKWEYGRKRGGGKTEKRETR